MDTEEKQKIGYREHFYGADNDDNRFQCFNCKYGKREENNGEMMKCCRWNIVTSEDDTCNTFEFSTYWAFNLTEEDKIRRKRKLENRKETPLYNNCSYQYSENRYAQYDTSVPNDTKSPYASREGCYIATAVYGGYDTAEVLVLRKFRDEVLKRSFLGRTFVKLYYALSPSIAVKLKRHDKINEKVKCLLDKFVNYLTSKM